MSPAEQIAAHVAAEHGLTLADLRTHSHRHKIVLARHEAMATLRQVYSRDGSRRYSTTWIGRLFGFDHTTVLHAVKAVERRRQG